MQPTMSRIVGFIRRRVSPRSAATWHASMTRAIARLADDAGQWPEADEAVAVGVDLRCRLVGRRRHVYRVLFTFDDGIVLVLRVVHAAQGWLTGDDLGP